MIAQTHLWIQLAVKLFLLILFVFSILLTTFACTWTWGNSRYNLVKTVLSYSNVMFNGHLLAINKMEEDDFIRARLLDLHEPSQGEEFIKYKHFIKINNSKRNRILVFVDWACKIWRKVEMDKWRSCLLLKLVEILEVFVVFFLAWMGWYGFISKKMYYLLFKDYQFYFDDLTNSF